MRCAPSAACILFLDLCGVFVCLGLMAACTTTAPIVVGSGTTAPGAPMPADPALVVRQGRYTLVEMTPERAQGDLMQQVVDITFPAAMIHSVADAVRYLLLRSGYRLGENCEAAHTFGELPLPAAHAHLGPLTLRDALQVIVGPGWQLQSDDVSRTTCFARSNSIHPIGSSTQMRSTERSQ